MSEPRLRFHPLDPERQIGSVCEVGPAYIKANLPDAASTEARWLHASRVLAGQVGEFVTVDCGRFAVLGRVLTVKLPERERLAVEPTMGKAPPAHPIGHIQLLTTVDLVEGVVRGGIVEYPRLGASVHSAPQALVKWIAEARSRSIGESKVLLSIATLPDHEGSPVSLTPEVLFGRHCAVLGTTGGGKSWTVARLLEESLKHRAKVLLLDPTGEFHPLMSPTVRHVHIGAQVNVKPADSNEVVVPYFTMRESDLIALFRPSGQSQAPKLRAAMRSLKLNHILSPKADIGPIKKAYQSKVAYEKDMKAHAHAVENGDCKFWIKHLPQQIEEECVYPTGQGATGAGHWGKVDEMACTYCMPLITRVVDMLAAPELACIFQVDKKPTINSAISDFMKSPDHRLLRVSMREVSFSFNAREIVANTIGRHLLELARQGSFKDQPLVVVLDEAHQFLNKSIGDEFVRLHLDAFDLIAKEGRKYGLTMVMATQRPRDIPDGVLSQMGTLLVHRLINDQDREVVERASGELDRSAAAFLPTLGPGQAIVVGVDFPVPVVLQIEAPSARPDSKGPDYQRFWAAATAQPVDEPDPINLVAKGLEQPAPIQPTSSRPS